MPDLPAAAAYLWDWFGELSLGLASGGFGPAVVTWEGVRAWRELMRLELDPWEVRALVRLGNLRAEVLAEDQPKPKAK